MLWSVFWVVLLGPEQPKLIENGTYVAVDGGGGVSAWFLRMKIRQSDLGIELLQRAYAYIELDPTLKSILEFPQTSLQTNI